MFNLKDNGKLIFLGLYLLVIVSLILTGCSNTGNYVKDIISEFQQFTLTINVNPEGAGTVTPASGSKFDKDTVVTLNPTPEEGWIFERWDGEHGNQVVNDNGEWEIVMDSNKNITAIFEETPNHPPSVTLSANPTSGPVPLDVTFTATASDPDGDSLTFIWDFDEVDDQQYVGGSVEKNLYENPDTYYVCVIVQDGKGGEASDNITINVYSGSNTPPVANDDTVTTDEDTPVNIEVLTNDSDPDGDPLSVHSVNPADHGLVEINPDNTFHYTPDSNFNGTDTFSYMVSDNNGGTDSAIVTVTVNPINDPPIANDDTATTNENNQVHIHVLDNDSEVDGDILQVSNVTQPGNGTTEIINGEKILYTPAADFTGTDTFAYTVSDGNGGTATATVTVTVNGLPSVSLSANPTSGTAPLEVNFSANASDPDGDVLTYTWNFGDGTTVADGAANETHTYQSAGTYNPTITVSDNNGGIASSQITITVENNPGNKPPVANDDTTTTDEDTSVTINVLSNDSDPEGDQLSVIEVTQGNHYATVTINANNTVTYSPYSNFSGTDSFTYTISDNNGGTASATVTVTVNPVNDVPVATDDTATTNEDEPVTINVLSNDSDPEYYPLSVIEVTQGANGTVTNNADGTVTYTPYSNFFGTDSFTYTISDGNGGEATATVTVTVNAKYDLTVAITGTGEVNLNPPGGSYDPGTTVELTASSDNGWSFDHWEDDLTGDENPATITMDADKRITARFGLWAPVENWGISDSGGTDYTELEIESTGRQYISYITSDTLNYIYVQVNEAGMSNFSKLPNGNSDVIGAADPDDGFSTAVAADDTLYIAYNNKNNSNKLMVKKYNESTSSWEIVGESTLPSVTIGDVSLAIDPSGYPYVAYKEYSGRIDVARFNGTKWEVIGPVSGAGDSVDLEIGPSGTLYLGFHDYNTGKIMIYSYNGNWDLIGQFDFGGYYNPDYDLAVDPFGNLHIAYEDPNYALTVKYYNGSSWTLKGQAGFYTDSSGFIYLSMDFDSSGIPYLAFRQSSDQRMTVVGYRYNKWGVVGKRSFSPTYPYFISLKVNPYDDQPYVGFANGDYSSEACVMYYYLP